MYIKDTATVLKTRISIKRFIKSMAKNYRIGCVFPRFGLLCALAYYAQHYCDFIMMFIMRFGLLRAFGL